MYQIGIGCKLSFRILCKWLVGGNVHFLGTCKCAVLCSQDLNNDARCESGLGIIQLITHQYDHLSLHTVCLCAVQTVWKWLAQILCLFLKKMSVVAFDQRGNSYVQMIFFTYYQYFNNKRNEKCLFSQIYHEKDMLMHVLQECLCSEWI